MDGLTVDSLALVRGSAFRTPPMSRSELERAETIDQGAARYAQSLPYGTFKNGLPMPDPFMPSSLNHEPDTAPIDPSNLTGFQRAQLMNVKSYWNNDIPIDRQTGIGGPSEIVIANNKWVTNKFADQAAPTSVADPRSNSDFVSLFKRAALGGQLNAVTLAAGSRNVRDVQTDPNVRLAMEGMRATSDPGPHADDEDDAEIEAQLAQERRARRLARTIDSLTKR